MSTSRTSLVVSLHSPQQMDGLEQPGFHLSAMHVALHVWHWLLPLVVAHHSPWYLEYYSSFLVSSIHIILWVVSASVGRSMIGSSSSLAVHFPHILHHLRSTTRRQFFGEGFALLNPWTSPGPRWPWITACQGSILGKSTPSPPPD